MDRFYLEADDAWERAARIMAVVHNMTGRVAPKVQPPDHFNDPLKIDDEKKDDVDWIGEEAARQAAEKNGQQVD